ncbi:MAG: hypothetical protein KDA91_11200 [Planctomycetaceae bacterium]|nr:hypothetical protein [Planctomycetaceae bacterium]
MSTDPGETVKIGDQLAEIQLQLGLLLESELDSAAQAPADTGTLTERIESLRSDIAALSESVNSRLGSAVEQLTEAQSNAVSSQGEIIRTLTEAIFTSSSGGGIESSQLESMFSEFESRILDGIRRTLKSSDATGESQTQLHAPDLSGIDSTVSDSSAEVAAPQSMSESGEQTWDDIRRALLAESGDSDPGESSACKTSVSDSLALPDPIDEHVPSPFSSVDPGRTQEFVLPEVEEPLEPPSTIDVETLDVHELRELVYERDRFICTLINRLRRSQQSNGQIMSIDQLQAMQHEMPEEFAFRVDRTLQAVDEQLRLSELELSLERARIARQAAQLEYARQQVENNARQLGYTVNHDGTLSMENIAAVRGSAQRRWLGKLGFSE